SRPRRHCTGTHVAQFLPTTRDAVPAVRRRRPRCAGNSDRGGEPAAQFADTLVRCGAARPSGVGFLRTCPCIAFAVAGSRFTGEAEIDWRAADKLTTWLIVVLAAALLYDGFHLLRAARVNRVLVTIESAEDAGDVRVAEGENPHLRFARAYAL